MKGAQLRRRMAAEEAELRIVTRLSTPCVHYSVLRHSTLCGLTLHWRAGSVTAWSEAVVDCEGCLAVIDTICDEFEEAE